jgi:hypothetical protein
MGARHGLIDWQYWHLLQNRLNVCGAAQTDAGIAGSMQAM